MAQLRDLYPDVRRKCPNVIDMMMLGALKDAFKEFAYVSELLTQTVTISSAKANVPNPLNIKTNHEMLKVDSVTFSERGRTTTAYQGDDYLITSANEIIFNKDRNDVVVVIILVPTSQNVEIEDKYKTLYGDAIAAGAASALRSQPSEVWFNPQMAESLKREFTEGSRRAYRDRRDNFGTFHNKQRKRSFF